MEDMMKALFIIVKAGFAEEMVKVARTEGAKGATIINARGGVHYQAVMGITVDSEKEIVLTLVNGKIACQIMSVVKEKYGIKSPAQGICFIMPVEKMTGIASQ